MIEVAEELEEDAQELAVTRHCYSFVYCKKGSLADVLSKPISLLRTWRRQHNADLAIVEIVVRLTGITIELPAGEASDTAIIASSSAYVVKLRVIAKGLDLEVYEIGVIKNHKEISTFIYFQFNRICNSNVIGDRTATLQIDDHKLRSIGRKHCDFISLVIVEASDGHDGWSRVHLTA